jgi:hypothetical protein
MRLALGLGGGNQCVVVEPLGLPQHRAGDVDRIVEGEFLISSASRPITSPKVCISSSLYRPAINKSVACHSARVRLSAVPREMASSRSRKKDLT